MSSYFGTLIYQIKRLNILDASLKIIIKSNQFLPTDYIWAKFRKANVG